MKASGKNKNGCQAIAGKNIELIALCAHLAVFLSCIFQPGTGMAILPGFQLAHRQHPGHAMQHNPDKKGLKTGKHHH